MVFSAFLLKLPMTFSPVGRGPPRSDHHSRGFELRAARRCMFQQGSEDFVPVQGLVGSRLTPEISGPSRGGENLRRSSPAHLLDGLDNVGAARPVLIMITCRSNIVESAPEAVNPNRPFQLAARAGKPVAAR